MRLAPLVPVVLLAAALPAAAAAPVVKPPQMPRAAHTATLLASGEVLVAGGCTLDGCEQDAESATTELFSARTNRFRPGPQLLRPRVGHGSVRLNDGSVLVFGGWTGRSLTATAERWQPGSKRFVAAKPMLTARGGFTVTTLRDGRVLVTGGTSRSGTLRSAELYLPARGRWIRTGPMREPRDGHTATLLPDGRVLVAGGSAEERRVLASAEIWSPRTGRFTPAASLLQPRHKHAAVAVTGGVLVLGGSDERDFAGRRSSAELYRVATHNWERVGSLSAPRFKLGDAVVAVPGGALVAGGGVRADRYDARTLRFSARPGTGRTLSFATATRLRNGRVLVVGGYDDRIAVVRGAWLLRP